METNERGFKHIAECAIINTVCDLLSPHSRKNTDGVYRHTVRRKIFYHKLNRNDIRAAKLLQKSNPIFIAYCESIGCFPDQIIRIKDYLIENKKDRLYAKKTLKAFFKHMEETTNEYN